VVREAFNQRRKTLRNTLKALLSNAEIEAAGVDGGLRPEQLDLAAFVRLADQLAIQLSANSAVVVQRPPNVGAGLLANAVDQL
jgi:16S rRNA (adenine1518-N6/adenine1519-N6)-dimethyltransferase